jgi:hypothetical protein
VALSGNGDTLAVGAVRPGGAHVFTRAGSVWSRQAFVTGSFVGGMGSSISLSADGNTLAVGAPYDTSNATGINGNEADTSLTSAGAVHVFARVAGTWTRQAYVKASNTDSYDVFGWSLALSADGNTLAVGAYVEKSKARGIDGNHLDNTAPEAGAVYVFTRVAGQWSHKAYVKASNTDANDHFGESVSLSGDGSILAVGASYEASNAAGINGNQADNSVPLAGAVYLY